MSASPEILAPAGCIRRLQTAVAFGADAVYGAATRLGLRKHADNFNEPELAAGIAFAQARGTKVYLTLNILPLERDWPICAPTIRRLARLRPDAVIVADPGIARLVREETGLRLHVSTQASVCNRATAELWRERGASRVVCARELGIEAAAALGRAAGVEVECFVHGAMCASYSGKCVISNYLAGRDANRGGCVQTCRHQFSDPAGGWTAPIMNARDLLSLGLMPRLAAAGIDACKIEGRMKSALYVAVTVAAYRAARDGDRQRLAPLRRLLTQLANRGHSSGALTGSFGRSPQNHAFDGYQGGLTSAGQVLATAADGSSLLALRTRLSCGDELHILRPDGSILVQMVRHLADSLGHPCRSLPTNRAAWIGCDEAVPAGSVAWLPQPGDYVCRNRPLRQEAVGV